MYLCRWPCTTSRWLGQCRSDLSQNREVPQGGGYGDAPAPPGDGYGGAQAPPGDEYSGAPAPPGGS